jgi:hypothetical protein
MEVNKMTRNEINKILNNCKNLKNPIKHNTGQDYYLEAEEKISEIEKLRQKQVLSIKAVRLA